MTILFPRKNSRGKDSHGRDSHGRDPRGRDPRGLTRRRFLSTAAAAGVSTIAMPHLSRAADRPQVTHGVQSGDVGADGGVIWARADRPSQMLVEVSTTE